MDILPVELRQEILQHLDIPSLKSIRLASRSWANIGEQYLIAPEFSTLPFRDDFNRLKTLAEHPVHSSRIESVQFKMGELNEYHGRHNIYYLQYMRDPEDRYDSSVSAWAEFSALKEKQSAFESSYCFPDLLENSFSLLPRLSSLKVSLATCPFTDELLRRVWEIPSTRLFPRVLTVERFSTILYASTLLPKPLTQLWHDRLPFEFWLRMQSTQFERLNAINVRAAFSSLTDLRLTSDYSTFPNDLRRLECFNGLCSALSSAPQLQILHLGFLGEASKVPVIFEELIGSMTWPSLHTLVLEGMILYETDLCALLSRHAPTLKRLRLGRQVLDYRRSAATDGVNLNGGSIPALFKWMRNSLNLEMLDLRGDLRWGIRPAWNVTMGVYDGDKWEMRDVPDDNALAAEAYVCRGGVFPFQDPADLVDGLEAVDLANNEPFLIS